MTAKNYNTTQIRKTELSRYQSMSDNKQLAKLEFVSFCIEQYKMATKQTGCKVEQLFQQRGVIDFLIDNYEVLHTQSAQFIQEEIVEYLNNHQQ